MKVLVESGVFGVCAKSVVNMSAKDFAYLCKMIGKSDLMCWISGEHKDRPFFAVGYGANVGTYYTALDGTFAEINPTIKNA